MSRLGPGRRSALTSAILGACSLGAAANDSAATLENALAHCAMIAAGDERLACYDALVNSRTRIASPSSASAASSPPSASSPPAAPQAPPTPTKEDFGLSTVQKQKTQPLQKQIELIKASVAGLATSSIGRMLIKLDNGQSWELDSADPLLAVGDAVTIQRAALGSFLLTTPSRRTHHVRRIH